MEKIREKSLIFDAFIGHLQAIDQGARSINFISLNLVVLAIFDTLPVVPQRNSLGDRGKCVKNAQNHHFIDPKNGPFLYHRIGHRIGRRIGHKK